MTQSFLDDLFNPAVIASYSTSVEYKPEVASEKTRVAVEAFGILPIIRQLTSAWVVGGLAYRPHVFTTDPEWAKGLDCDIIFTDAKELHLFIAAIQMAGYSYIAKTKLGGERYKSNLLSLPGQAPVTLANSRTIDFWYCADLHERIRTFPKGVGFAWRPEKTIYVEREGWSNLKPTP